MLRQVFLIANGKIIVEHHIGKGFSSDEMITVIRKLKDYMGDSSDDKIYHRPMMNFQIIYANLNNTFYLFVTDFVDKVKYFEDSIRKLAQQVYNHTINYADDLEELFEKPELRKFQDQIYEFIEQEVKNFLPKVTLVGPFGAGKTTLAKMLAIDENEPPRKLMTFAEIYKAEINDVPLEIWDFVEQNFSPLWNNFTRGSDLILLVFNATSITKNIIHFITVCKKEGKNSKIITLLSNSKTPGAIDGKTFMSQYGSLMPPSEIFEYDIVEPDVKSRLQGIISTGLRLKEPLPPEFLQILRESNNAVKEEDYGTAVEKIEKLISIAEDYQEVKYVKTLKIKLEELNAKWEEKQKRMLLEQSQIKAPEKKEFKAAVKVKSLPGVNPPPAHTAPKPGLVSPSGGSTSTAANLSAPQQPTADEFTSWSNGILAELNQINSQYDEMYQWQLNIYNDLMGKPVVQVTNAATASTAPTAAATAGQTGYYQSQSPAMTRPATNFQKPKPAFKPKITKVKHAKPEEAKRILYEEAKLLNKYIESMGKSLRMELCVKFVEQIRQKIKKIRLNEEDIKKAAELYVKKLKGM